jgi:hypothetical protein
MSASNQQESLAVVSLAAGGMAYIKSSSRLSRSDIYKNEK